MLCIATGTRPDPGCSDHQAIWVDGVVQAVEPSSPRRFEPHGVPLTPGGVREPRGVHGDVSGRRPPPSQQPVHLVEELGVQSSECLLEDGIAWRPLKTEEFKELRVGGELGHEAPVAEAGVELEAQEDKESREGKIDRSAQGRGSGGDHSTKLHKLMEQELRMTRLGCVVR